MKPFRRRLSVALALAFLLLARPALPFCGFYVAKADTKLFNRASQVVLVRTDPGYAANPGQAGSGTVIGVLCQ